MYTSKIRCVATLQGSSTMFWEFINLHTGNTTLRICQALLIFMLNLSTQSFK